MNLIFFWLFVGIASASASAASTSAASTSNNQSNIRYQNKPTNILLLLTDDQDVVLGSFDYMPYVKQHLQTQGITFENAFVHTPVCCPSRSSILTGRYLHHGKLAHNNSISGNCYGNEWKTSMEPYHTFAVHAQNAGYTTAYVGKYLNQYHHGKNKDNLTASCNSSIPNGWDYWLGLEGNSRYYNYTLVESYPGIDDNGGVKLHHHNDVYPQDYLPLVLQNYTLRLLNQSAELNGTASSSQPHLLQPPPPPPPLKEPWLLVIAWPTPHAPFTQENWAKGQKQNVEIPKPPNYNATAKFQQTKHWLLRKLRPLTNQTETTITKFYQSRLEALLTIDNHVNAIVQILSVGEDGEDHSESDVDANDQASAMTATSSSSCLSSSSTTTKRNTVLDRTVIIYTSDNGFQFGEHRIAIDKRHLYEHDIRVPFVIRGPKNDNTSFNITIKQIVANIDIAPTILDIIKSSSSYNNECEHKADMEIGILEDAVKNQRKLFDQQRQQQQQREQLQRAINDMDGLSFWKYIQNYNHQSNNHNTDDPFAKRNDILISYHGEGFMPCGLAECPPPYDGIWYMPDSFNNTYHCVRTINEMGNIRQNNDDNNNATITTTTTTTTTNTNNNDDENSIYCMFHDDESFVEYYDLNTNPYQLLNQYIELPAYQIQRYEKRLQELLS